MKKAKLILAISFLMLLGTCAGSLAAIINISLDSSDWDLTLWQDPYGRGVTTGNLSVNGDGNLQGTKTNYRYGRITARTQDTYDFQNSTLRFKWKVYAGSGTGDYGATLFGTDAIHYFDPNGQVAAFYSTNHSWIGSEVIQNDSWIFSEISFSETSYDYTMSYSGYGGTDFLIGSAAMATTQWEALADDHFIFRMADNYHPGSYFEIEEASIETADTPVPEPTTILLFGVGLVGLVGSRFRRNKR